MPKIPQPIPVSKIKAVGTTLLNLLIVLPGERTKNSSVT